MHECVQRGREEERRESEKFNYFAFDYQTKLNSRKHKRKQSFSCVHNMREEEIAMRRERERLCLMHNE
jgi:hypothetical protein